MPCSPRSSVRCLRSATYRPRCSWLQASGKATDESDIDVAVLLDQAPGSSERKAVLGGLIEALGQQLRADRLDIVILNGAPPNLAFHALKGGLVAFERSPELLHRFRVGTYSRHSDYEPVERFFRSVTKPAGPRCPRG